MSMKFARGTHAFGECQRSGRKMLLRDMVRDGYYPNLLVDPAWRDDAHPQDRPQVFVDPEGLQRPSPENERVSITVRLPIYDLLSGEMSPRLSVGVVIGQPQVILT
jgi:hypothetical protein